MSTRMLLIETSEPVSRAKVVEIEADDTGSELASIYKHLKCDCIDATTCTIGGKVYTVYCDDEGLFKEPLFFGAVAIARKDGKVAIGPALAGNLLIFNGPDYEGNCIGLEDDDIERICRSIRLINQEDADVQRCVDRSGVYNKALKAETREIETLIVEDVPVYLF